MTAVRRYFTVAEMVRSDRAEALGINNTPPEALRGALFFTLASMERMRAFLDKPVVILSGYRCAELNLAVGGAKDSQHMHGEAVDFICPGFGDPRAVFSALVAQRMVLGIDQIILEPTWVHVSFTMLPRYDVLIASQGKYIKGLT